MAAFYPQISLESRECQSAHEDVVQAVFEAGCHYSLLAHKQGFPLRGREASFIEESEFRPLRWQRIHWVAIELFYIKTSFLKETVSRCGLSHSAT